MGLVNDIGTKKDIKCLKCKKSLRYDTEHPVYKDTIIFQSKDMSNRMNSWMIGDKIIIKDGGLSFTSKDSAIWTGCGGCPHCRTPFECDIVIKNGTIKEIKNLREYKYE